MNQQNKLHRVRNSNDSKSLGVLAKYGESFNKQQTQRSPLHLSTIKKNKEKISHLLKRGANPLIKDGLGLSSLDLAFQHPDLDCLLLLLEASPVKDLQWCWNVVILPFNDIVFQVLVVGSTVFPSPAFFLSYKSPFHVTLDDKLQQLICVVHNKTDLETGHESPSFINWLDNWKHQVKSLQYLSRIAVRRSLSYNVYYSANKLPLPTPLQKYLTDFTDVINTQQLIN